MNLENQINIMIKKAILDEIDNLAIKAVVREHIENAISKNEIVERVDGIIDSYFRSALNEQDVNATIRAKINSLVEDRINGEMKQIIGNYSSWRGSDAVKDMLLNEIGRQIGKGFNITLDIKQKTTPTEKGN